MTVPTPSSILTDRATAGTTTTVSVAVTAAVVSVLVADAWVVAASSEAGESAVTVYCSVADAPAASEGIDQCTNPPPLVADPIDIASPGRSEKAGGMETGTDSALCAVAAWLLTVTR